MLIETRSAPGELRAGPEGTRFSPAAAATLARAIHDAGGIEVFAIGTLDEQGVCKEIEVLARGNDDAVPALIGRARPGQIVVHNHPSGLLKASEADLAIASIQGEDGIGVVIVDNRVERALWVVEPHVQKILRIDPAEVRSFFEERLSRALPGYEAREAQVAMAMAFTERLNDPGILVAEAGTGTGKSLSYLVPAVLWASANRTRVAISTFTKALQDQLMGADIPLLKRAGLCFEAASMKGRSNYLCRRKLEAALSDAGIVPREGRFSDPSAGRDDDSRLLAAIADWAAVSADGLGSTLPFQISGELWERVESDRHQSLRVKCPHYSRCFYYEARRKAAAAQILVLNHHLLLNDLLLKQSTGGRGILPPFDRVVLDEAHHIEEAATGVHTSRVSALGIRRAIAGLLPRRDRRAGALDRVRTRWGGVVSPLPEARRVQLVDAVADAERLCETLREEATLLLENVAYNAGMQDVPLTLDPLPARRRDGEAGEDPPPDFEEPRQEPTPPPSWMPAVTDLAERLQEASKAIERVERHFEKVRVDIDEIQPLLDVRRSMSRLQAIALETKALAVADSRWCRWVEPERKSAVGVLCRAPIEPGSILAETLHAPMKTALFTSATLTVGRSFEYFLGRSGIREHTAANGPPPFTALLPSPFDFPTQCLLGLPRDLPAPDQPGYEEQSGKLLLQLVRLSGGGAFVLCTSFRQVEVYGDLIERALGGRLRVLRQQPGSRQRLLEGFLQGGPAVLLGVDTFWEGVSVKGDALRLVIIPRLPFGVPTEPVALARYARIEASGQDPFRVASLPHAVLRLRQGFGRLIRAHSDSGAVVLLDRRVHDRWYGRFFLDSLPPAQRVLGPSRLVLARLQAFYRERFPSSLEL